MFALKCRFQHRAQVVFCLTLALLLLPKADAQDGNPLTGFSKLDLSQDWPWWRGPHHNGLATSDAIPTRFGESENVLWKTPVPGRGHSSPIVVGGHVFLATADETRQTQSVVAFDARTGAQVWIQQINQGGFPERNHAKNTEASPTIASDGELLFIPFFHHRQIQLTALDLNGKQVWQKTAGPFNPKKYEYGYAPSPLLYKNVVIIAAEHDGASYIVAYDRATGNERWRATRPTNITFSSPVIAKVAGRDQMLISGSERVASYDPSNGRLLWAVPGTTAATCGTMVWHDNLVIASGGYPKAETIAVVADGSRRIAWKNNQKCYEQSMIIVDGYLYGLTDKGVMYCWRAKDGQEMWRERLAGPVSASPVYAGGNIYWANERGTCYVFRPNPQRFELIAENRLGNESFASPAVANNQMYLRVAMGRKPNRSEYLFCIGAGVPND